MIQDKIYLAFYRGLSNKSAWKRFKQRFVKLWTGGPYCHCEIIHQSAMKSTWYGALTYNPEGVGKRELVVKSKNWDIFDITEFVDNESLLKFLNSKVGLKYDWLGIYLYQFIPIGIDRSDRYYCSEYLAEALGFGKPAQYNPNSFFKKVKLYGFL